MPVVTAPSRGHDGLLRRPGARGASLFPRCANPACATGWIHVWRSRQVPAFEGRWACSPACMGELVAAAVRREMDGSDVAPAPHAHRVPLGLLLLERGRITPAQLRAAVEGQKNADPGETLRLGEWLLRSGVLSERALTQARSAQWNCPVFSLANDRPGELAAAMPAFLAEAFGALPIRTSAGKLLYVAFTGQLDRTLSYALERMTGLRVVAGIAADAEFAAAREKFLAAPGPRTRFVEAASSWVLVRTLTKVLETARPVEARLVRIHEHFWLRIWRRAQKGPGLPPPGEVEDLLATVGRAPGDGEGISGSESPRRADKAH